MKRMLIIAALMTAGSLLAIICGLPEAARTRMSLIRERPALAHYYDSEEGHFKIWYNLETDDPVNCIDSTDSDGNGVPDWAENAASYLEKSWDYLVNQLGARQPVPDFGGGGDDRVDVYFVELHSSIYGMTWYDSVLSNGTAPAYIEIENDFAGFTEYEDREEDALAVTCAHEFFHTIHFAYGTLEQWRWWMEATAVWSEEQNFPQINDYINYLDIFQENPEIALNDDTPSNRIYGTVLLPLFLSANYGDGTIIDLWERTAGSSVYQAFGAWSDSIGISMDSLYGDFARWNLYVGGNYRSGGYIDGAIMPEPVRISRDSIPPNIPGGGSAIYIELTNQFGLPPGHEGGGWAELPAGDSVHAAMHGIASGFRSDTPDTAVYIFGAPDTIPGLWRYDAIVASIANFDVLYIHSANLGNLLVGPATLAKVLSEHDLSPPPYPNPFYYDGEGYLYFPYSLEEDSYFEFSVWTASGDIVYYEDGQTSKGNHLTTDGAFRWQPSNQSGKRLTSGIYIYRLAVVEDEHIGKFAIINEKP